MQDRISLQCREHIPPRPTSWRAGYPVLFFDEPGRASTTKSFIWVHTTGDLDRSVKPIVLYSYEPTRGTDHLRNFYCSFQGILSSDAYVSYLVLEKERIGEIVSSGCFMHCRKRFADALKLRDLGNMTEEQLKELPEYKILLQIEKMYYEESQLRELSPENRLKRRQKTIRPMMDTLFEMIHGIDLLDPLLSYKLKDAVNYTMNNEDRLQVFLSDGNVPMDNGFCERCVKPWTRIRNNSLFNDSVKGVNASTIILTMVETAKQNGANPLYYFQYLLEQIPRNLLIWKL